MTAEHEGVSPASAGGASASKLCFAPVGQNGRGLAIRCDLPWGHPGAHHGVAGIDYGLTVRPAIPEPFRRMFWVAAEDIANVIGCTVVEGEPRGYGGPDPRDTDPGKLREIANALHALLGEEDCTERAVTLGHLWYLVRLVAGLLDAISDRNRPGPPKPDPRDAEIERLRAELVDYRTRLGNDLLRGGELVERVRAAMRVDDGGTCTRASIGVVGDYLGRLIDVLDVEVRQHEQTTAELAERHRELGQVRAELVRERAIYADSPDDRLYHAADNTWWRRNDNGRLVEAEMPELGDITAERDQLRQQLDQHLADENSAQAANDRLRQELDLQHADRLRWLCQALNIDSANETWLTAMRRVRHLRQNFSDSPRCEVSESDGWRCRLFAGHDGRHLAQMPTGERREWPFDNRLTPRYWRAGDPEPEIGTTVRQSGDWGSGPTWTRRRHGWHPDHDCSDRTGQCGGAGPFWSELPRPLVEVVNSDGD